MDIKVVQAEAGRLKQKPVFAMDFESGKGWLNPRIEPYGNLSIDPAAMGLHYGQEIFEGLKGYRGKDGGLYLFRAKENFKRM
ncbi:MAG: branched chain amino acid aminotransferase, partial [Deltaproteobacteria bacterium]|nr:branched chain amino acid aminotransferase [Deltaproteobacteria bacterium]